MCVCKFAHVLKGAIVLRAVGCLPKIDRKSGGLGGFGRPPLTTLGLRMCHHEQDGRYFNTRDSFTKEHSTSASLQTPTDL